MAGGGEVSSANNICTVSAKNSLFFIGLDPPFCGKYLCYSPFSHKNQKTQWLVVSGQWSVVRGQGRGPEADTRLGLPGRGVFPPFLFDVKS
jgi:hypothetical protein